MTKPKFTTTLYYVYGNDDFAPSLTINDENEKFFIKNMKAKENLKKQMMDTETTISMEQAMKDVD